MATARKDDPTKVDEYRRTLQDLAASPKKKKDGSQENPAAALEGKAAKLATEIQGEQSKAPPTKHPLNDSATQKGRKR